MEQIISETYIIDKTKRRRKSLVWENETRKDSIKKEMIKTIY